eukprot:m.227232 g.227232  ORF g.227232 m.227232 type:complete len:222 (-) comp17155_c0_seq1:28-693(-)
MDQMELRGEVDCAHFDPNPVSKRICRQCQRDIQAHKKEAVTDPSVIQAALELVQNMRPSTIIPAADGLGALLQGGVAAAAPDALAKFGVGRVVSAAKSLESCFPAFAKYKAEAAKTGVEFLVLPWIDVSSQELGEENLTTAVRFIAAGRATGQAVLVHCAQGRSRSSACVVAYMLAVQPARTVPDALAELRSRRRMAEPNSGFVKELEQLHARGFFASILS